MQQFPQDANVTVRPHRSSRCLTVEVNGIEMRGLRSVDVVTCPAGASSQHVVITLPIYAVRFGEVSEIDGQPAGTPADGSRQPGLLGPAPGGCGR